MKRALFVVMCCVFGLICEVGYSQWFWHPSFFQPIYYSGGCANGQCYRSCPNGKCGVKKRTETEETVNDSFVREESDAKTADLVTDDTEKPVPTAEFSEEGKPEEAVESDGADNKSENSESETGLIVPTPNDSLVPLTENEEQKAVEPKGEKGVVEFTVCPFTQRVIELINWHRSQFGLPALVVDNSLVVGCQHHSRYMASYGFGHAYGIGGMECIAMGVNTPESVVNMWLNSSGHRAIIMSRSSKIGFGSFGTYHTLRVR